MLPRKVTTDARPGLDRQRALRSPKPSKPFVRLHAMPIPTSSCSHALTRPSVRVWKCVAPIQCLSVPKTCSTMLLRMVIASGFRSSRRCNCFNSNGLACHDRPPRVAGHAGIFVPASRLLRTNDPVPLCMKHALLATHPPATGLCLPVCRIRPTVADAARRNLCRVHRR